MKQTVLSAILAMVFVAPILAQEKDKRSVADFSSVLVTKGANISLIQCDKTELEIVTDGGPTSDVLTTVDKGQLEISMKKRSTVEAVQVFIYFKDIESLTVKRGASVETDCVFAHKGTFTADIASNCEAKLELDVDRLVLKGNTCIIKLEGRADEQDVVVSGSVGESTYDASQLESRKVNIKAVDTDATVKFSEKLDANAVNCTIKYIGDEANVRQTTSSGGQVVATKGGSGFTMPF